MSTNVVTKPLRGLNLPQGHFHYGNHCLVDNCRHSTFEETLVNGERTNIRQGRLEFSEVMKRYRYTNRYLGTVVNQLIINSFKDRVFLRQKFSGEQRNHLNASNNMKTIDIIATHYNGSQ